MRKTPPAGEQTLCLACGGDGTIHEVLQCLASKTGKPTAALGIIPLGSANALARHLRLSLDPVKAALQQLQGALAHDTRWPSSHIATRFVTLPSWPERVQTALLHTVSCQPRIQPWAAGLLRSRRRPLHLAPIRPFEVEYIEAESGVTTHTASRQRHRGSRQRPRRTFQRSDRPPGLHRDAHLRSFSCVRRLRSRCHSGSSLAGSTSPDSIRCFIR